MTPRGDGGERRAFIRDHHPDRGGDPEQFRVGLERFDAAAPTPNGGVRVTMAHSRRGVRGLARRAAQRWSSRGAPPRVR